MAGASPGAVSPGDWSLSGGQVSSIHQGPTRDALARRRIRIMVVAPLAGAMLLAWQESLGALSHVSPPYSPLSRIRQQNL
jgi:hypothetical protein